jgi:hypothetical protein
MKTLVLGTPESLPPELADNPDVIVLDPSELDDDMIASLDAAVGGMLLGEDGESGEGDLVEWAEEEEKEHAHADDEDGKGGYGDDEEEDEEKKHEDEEEDGKGNPLNPFSKRNLAAMAGGMGHYGKGDDEEEDEEKKKRDEDDAEAGKGARRGGRGGSVSPLSAWARAMGGRGR